MSSSIASHLDFDSESLTEPATHVLARLAAQAAPGIFYFLLPCTEVTNVGITPCFYMGAGLRASIVSTLSIGQSSKASILHFVALTKWHINTVLIRKQ